MNKRNREEWNCGERKSRGIPIAVNNLVVCCGERTEYNYFTKAGAIIKENYTPITGVNFDIEVDAVDPLNMAKNVEESFRKSKKRGQQYHQIWVVFDKDDFKKDNFDNAVNRINNLNEIYKDDEVKFHALWSNECIELWFVLHFMYLTANILRTEYMKKLTELLEEKYQKNDKELFEKIMKKNGSIDDAIRYAKKLASANEGKTPSNSVPATMVYEFFETYREYIN